MRRLTYLIPRMLILLLAMSAIWISRDALVKSAIVHRIQQVTNAQCEIGHVQTSWGDGQIFLRDVRIADPRDPMRNLVQADSAIVELDLARLMFGEIVIRDGKARQILFGSPRTTPGTLDPDVTVEQSLIDQPPIRIRNEVAHDQLKQGWLDRFHMSEKATSDPLSQTRRKIEQIRRDWQRQLARLEAEVDQMVELREKTAQWFQTGAIVGPPRPPRNPLRDDRSQIQKVSVQAKSLRSRLREVHAAMEAFDEQREQDTSQLLELARREANSPGEIKVPDRFDGATLSQLLLADLQQQQLQEIMDWFTWFRRSIPDPATDFQLGSLRGEDFEFRTEVPPRVLVESLELTGEGRIAGQFLAFTGVAENLSTDPRALGKPTVFRLRADGNQQLVVQCAVDRTTDTKRDQFKVIGSGLPMKGRLLGSRETLEVTLSDHQMGFQVDLTADGDRLEGQVAFRHSELILHVDSVHSLAGGQDAALRANREVASVVDFNSSVKIRGTVDFPVFVFESDLGERLAIALNDTAHELAVRRSLEARREAERELIESIDEIVEELKSRHEAIDRNVRGEQQVVQDLVDRVAELEQAELLPRIR